MRGVSIGVLGVLVGVLTWAVNAGTPTTSAAPPTRSDSARERADHLICPLAEFIRSDTQIALLAGRGGSVDLQRVSGGEWSSYRKVDLGDAGGWIGGVPSGSGVLMAESGAGWSGAGMVNTAPGSKSTWMCGESSDMLMALGGSTLEEDHLDLILYNPYIWDSTSRVAIISELGEDTPAGLREVYVPAGKTVKVSLDEPLRLRRFLGVHVESSPGRVAFLLQQAGNQETAIIEGSIPHTEWWLPIPDLEQTETHLLVASPSDAPSSYRLDLMTETGPVYGFVEDDLLPGQLIAVPLSDLPADVTGIRVSGTVGLVAALRMESDGLLAIGPGASGTSRRWFLPGAGGDGKSRNLAWLLNPSVLPVSATVSAVAEGAFSLQITIAPESVLAFDLDLLSGLAENLPGYLVEAEEEIAVVRTSQTEDGAASYSAGAPVD